MAQFDSFVLRKATNSDLASIWPLISGILGSYGIQANRATTDSDLIDIEAAYWKQAGAFYVLLDGERLIGTVALRPESNTTCELCRMYLDPQFRGRGLGRRLFEHALCLARAGGYHEMLLKTASSLKEAIKLYHSAGFRTDKCASSSGNCDLVMRMLIR